MNNKDNPHYRCYNLVDNHVPAFSPVLLASACSGSCRLRAAVCGQLIHIAPFPESGGESSDISP